MSMEGRDQTLGENGLKEYSQSPQITSLLSLLYISPTFPFIHPAMPHFTFGELSCKHLICIFHLTKVLMFKDCGYLICFLEPREILVLTSSGTDIGYEGFLGITALTTYSGTKIFTFSSALGCYFLVFKQNAFTQRLKTVEKSFLFPTVIRRNALICLTYRIYVA